MRILKMWMLVSLVANIIRTYAVFRCMEHYFMPKERFRDQRILGYLAFVILTSGGYFIFNAQYINICTNLCGLLLLSLWYKSKWVQRLFMISVIYVFNIVIECMVLFAFSVYPVQDKINASIHECIVSLSILLAVAIIEKTTPQPGKTLLIDGFQWLLLIAVPIVSIVLVVVITRYQLSENMVIVIIVTTLLLTNVFVFYQYHTLQNYYAQKAEKEIIKQQINYYDNEFNILKTSYFNIRALRHDMKHHLKELQFLADKYKVSEMTAYIEQMSEYMDNPKERVSSGNREIDSTLNYLLQKADQELIHTETHVTIPEEIQIDSFIVNVVLGNLLENAIEAAVKTDEKYMRTDVSIKSGLLYIRVENSYDGPIHRKGHKIITSKKNREAHGFGLQNVRTIVEEKHGIMEVSTEKERFTVNIMMYLSAFES